MENDEVVLFIRRFDPERTTKLSLSNRDIDSIPAEIGELKNLKHLDLSYNNITDLPVELFGLENLETLLLFRNKITDLPTQISRLKNLSLLDISYNPIKEIPPEIGSLINLKTFDAGHCNVTHLPLDFIKLLSLKDLYLEENPLVFPPLNVVMRGLYATMYHLAQEKKKRDAAKVVVQVYNMPEEIQIPFKQYVSTFNDVVSNINSSEIKFEIKFINQYLQNEIELEVGVENYLYDFLKFIKENLESLRKGQKENVRMSMFDLQVVELRNEIIHLNDSLNEKMSELKIIQQKINQFTSVLDHKH